MKPTLFGLVTKKSINISSNGLSHVSLWTKEHGEVLLAFDTYAKIGCKHPWFFGRSQCFHDKGSELEVLIRVDSYIKVKVEEMNTEETLYVYRLMEP
jgi:hypothetical protein